MKTLKDLGQTPAALAAAGAITIAAILLTRPLPPAVALHEPEQIRTSCIAPPLPAADLPFEDFHIDAAAAVAVETRSGSRIIAPEQSLVDASGMTVHGKVTLRYREFNDAVDCFLSGIPMTYDSAGRQYHFESAGMFELMAFSETGEVQVAPGKTWKVEYASQVQGGRFNIYSLDEKAGNWKYRYDDVPREAALSPALPPLQTDPGRWSISLDVVPQEFPEIAALGDVRFELTDTNQPVDPGLAARDWDHVSITRTADGNYLIRLLDGNERFEFVTRPVVDRQNYHTALQRFHTRFDDAQERKEEKEAKLLGIRKEQHLKFAQQKEEQKNSLAAWQNARSNASASQTTAGLVVRIFEVSSFGIYNSDCPRDFPSGAVVAAVLHDRDAPPGKATLKFDRLYLVEKDRRALYTYYNYAVKDFSFNPSSENFLWTVTDDNRLAIFTYDDFKKVTVPDAGETYIFRMKVIDRTFTRPEDVRTYLDI